MKEEVSFNDIDNFLSKIDSRGSISSKNEFNVIDEYIHTGNYLLNAQISGTLFGGIPNTRTIAFAGETGTGKTFLSLNICREAQKQGYNIIYCDTEAAVDKDIFLKFGVNPDKVRYQPISTVKEFKYIITNLINKINEIKNNGKIPPKILIVLDSIGNLATDKEKYDAIQKSDKKDLTKQQELRSLFRIITTDLAGAKIPFIITAHTYTGINSFIPENVMGGGGGPLYNSSFITFLYKSKLKENVEENVGTKSTGIIVTSSPYKSRFTRPIPIRFHISFYKGMNPYIGLEQFISWKNCGIERGILLEEKEYQKLSDKEKEKIQSINGEFIFNDKKLYFYPKETARKFVVKHLGTTIEPNKLFTPDVFTKEVLEELDNNIIKQTFLLPNYLDIYEVEDSINSLLEDIKKDYEDE